MLESARRHMEVLRGAWASERGAAPSRKRFVEQDFLPAAIEILERPPSPAGRLLLWLAIGFTLIAFAWSLIGRVDVVAAAPGKLVPKGDVKVIQPAELGVVRAIHVQDGDRVHAGQVLIELDPTLTSADQSRAENEGIVASAGAARGEAILHYLDGGNSAYVPPDGTPQAIARVQESLEASQIAEFEARQAAQRKQLAERQADLKLVEREIAKLHETLPLLQQQVDAKRILVDKGLSSKLLFLELQERYVGQLRDLDIEIERLEKVRATIETTEREIDQQRQEFRKATLSDYAENGAKAASLAQELVKAAKRNGLQRLVAPVDGVVQEVAVHTIGGVVQAGDKLLVVVPGGTKRAVPLVVQAWVLNKDIGFVTEGQSAEVKLDAFPFTRYGVLHGRVESLGRDAVEDKELGMVYPATISLDQGYIIANGRKTVLGAGMVANVEIRTGTRRIIDYVLSPIVRYTDESFRER